ncbi:isoleucine--tRNA ligase [Opitutus sp. ER46]|uniref:isoleucine--tRNA ligase n=1 Tax=Opitutus sp. ER46 TaxID=2161864 RepID=UPI000D31CFB6|nr:isoleucine--tRNA ligase [Opitutus sp. ER46]PTX91245.1 isoleucine--tRNA ligase [Opitutus sp. ER46]
MAQDLKDTLQLPRTDFPMRAGLAQREPGRVAHWEKTGLYNAIQRKNSAGPVFVLHDGPPFTNGDVHIGTALNKVLKDTVMRYKSMRGFRTPYVPGWDCHGLPIEQKVSREIQEKKLQLTTAEMRARCDAFSEGWIAKQTGQFKRLGVLGEWDASYKTKAPAYEADIIRTFAAFIERGLVYRSKKPVYWSIPFETALAEAEIEYKDHVSPSIWVRFAVPAAEATKFGLPADKPLAVVIWTTTPWTIPANLAIAVHPDVEYVVADLGGERLLVAEPLLGSVLQAAKFAGTPAIVHRARGATLEHLAPRHPFIDRASPVVLADYVTTDSGTGCVHTAPGHGAEDYLTGLKYKLEVYCPVGDDGRYVDDGRVPADLVGLSTLESVEDLAAKRTSPANIAVLKKLAAAGALLAKERFPHSYPHCWRSKTPIIFRAVDQWFVSLDKDRIRTKALAEVEQIAANHGWIPAWGEARIRGAVESRPDWCISRQRSWGVPIPAFYDARKQAYLDAGVARAVADKIATAGTNLWYNSTAAQLLEGVTLPAGWPAASELTCGRDTLDVWIDSGSSHAAVLRRAHGGTHWPADLYLEGSDQHRGWFQSSLWTSVIAFNSAPYKAVLTHGFIVGKDGKKISKSGQYEKPPTSDNYVNQYGADVIRLWIASQDFREDIRVSDLDKDLKNPSSILNVVAESYRLFRNTFRYQLSTLFDFDPAQDLVPVAQMDTLDRWALHQTAQLIRECTAAYEAYEFHRVYQLCNQFCSVTLSATYHDVLKDRLYTLGTRAPLRRSSQTAIYHIFRSLARLLAPVLTFTCDEAWSYATAKVEYTNDSIHLQSWPEAPAEWTDAALEAEMAALLRIRTQVNEAIEPQRAAGKLGKSLDAAVEITPPAGDPTTAALERHRAFLPELFIVSHVGLGSASGAQFNVSVRPCAEHGFVRCPRCWRWVPTVETTPHGAICPRCAEALKS